MKIGLKQAIKFILLSIWCVGLSIGVLALHQSFFPPISDSDLNKLEQTFNLALQHEEATRSESIEQLFNVQKSLKFRQDSDQLALQTVREHQNHLENALSETKTSINRTLSQSLETIEKRLNKKLSSARKNNSFIVENKKPKVTPVQPKQVITPPFILFDIQTRGSVHLAIVGKPSARALSDLLPLRIGQSYLGWRIVQISSNSIVANFQGELIDIEVRS